MGFGTSSARSPFAAVVKSFPRLWLAGRDFRTISLPDSVDSRQIAKLGRLSTAAVGDHVPPTLLSHFLTASFRDVPSVFRCLNPRLQFPIPVGHFVCVCV